MLELYLVKGFLFKKCCFADFSIKKLKLPPVSGDVLCILADWESYLTPRRQIGVLQEEGGSQRESSLLPIGHLGVIYDSQPHGYAF